MAMLRHLDLFIRLGQVSAVTWTKGALPSVPFLFDRTLLEEDSLFFVLLHPDTNPEASRGPLSFPLFHDLILP